MYIDYPALSRVLVRGQTGPPLCSQYRRQPRGGPAGPHISVARLHPKFNVLQHVRYSINAISTVVCRPVKPHPVNDS